MELAALLRPLGRVAGPAAVLAFVLFAAAMITAPEDGLDDSPLATGSSALLLIALLGIGATALAALARLRDGARSVAGAAVAAVGTVLVAGGTWAALFVMPAIAAEAPEVLDGELAGVVVGYIASYLVFAVGWVWAGLALRRAGVVSGWLGALLAVGGVASFVPSPEVTRLLVISITASIVAGRLAAPVAVRVPATVP